MSEETRLCPLHDIEALIAEIARLNAELKRAEYAAEILNAENEQRKMELEQARDAALGGQALVDSLRESLALADKLADDIAESEPAYYIQEADGGFRYAHEIETLARAYLTKRGKA